MLSRWRTLRNWLAMRNLGMWFFRAPVSETNHPALIDEHVLCKEEESSPNAPHTLIMEAVKPTVHGRA